MNRQDSTIYKVFMILYPLALYFLMDVLIVWAAEYLLSAFAVSQPESFLAVNTQAIAAVVFLVITIPFGFLPQTQTGNSGGQVQPLAACAIAFLTMRSSSEWKVMTASRPPGFSRSIARCIICSTEASSSFTAIRIA